MSEIKTFHKLALLYLLRAAKAPLSTAALSDFFVAREYMSFFTLKDTLEDLVQDAFLASQKEAHRIIYTITQKGEETVSLLEEQLSAALRRDIREYVWENRLKLRDERDVKANAYPEADGSYAVHAVIKEGKTSLLELTVSVPTREEAESFLLRWPSRAQQIYADIMKDFML